MIYVFINAIVQMQYFDVPYVAVESNDISNKSTLKYKTIVIFPGREPNSLHGL